jgi:hypothetical protein
LPRTLPHCVVLSLLSSENFKRPTDKIQSVPMECPSNMSCDDLRNMLVEVTKYYYSLPPDTDDIELKNIEDRCKHLGDILEKLLAYHKDCKPAKI